MWAKQSTAATLIVGPILDSTGAEYTSAVIGDLSISKNGGTLTALEAAATLTHIANGQYTLVMTTGNLDTLGRAQITCNKSTYQMPEVRLMVVPAMVFDSMILGSDRFDVNVTHVTDTAQTAGDIYASQVAIAGYIDTEVGEIKAKTDQLTFTTANKVDSTAVLDSGITDQFDAIETAVDAGNNYHVTTLARLGSWAGTGVNTILGAFRAIAAKLPGITPTDISSGTTYNNAAHSLESAATIANTAIAPAPLERNPTDTGVITFAWPVSGATITGTVSIDNSEYVAVAGSIAFLREDSGRYYYTLSYSAADRPAAAGSARYTLTDGEYTRYVILRVVESGDTGEATAMAVLKLDWQTVTGEVPSRSVLNALRHIRNKWALDGHTKTVYAEDDATPAYTTTVTADGTGNITADTPN